MPIKFNGIQFTLNRLFTSINPCGIAPQGFIDVNFAQYDYKSDNSAESI